MLFVVLAILGMLALLDKTLRLDRRELVKLETRFEFDRLYHRLFMAVEDGVQPNNEWATYAGEFIDRTKAMLSYAPIWVLALLFVGLGGMEKEQLEKQKSFERALERPENEPLREVYVQYRAALHRFLRVRLPMLFWFARKMHNVSDRIEKAESNIPTAATSEPNLLIFASKFART